MTSRERSEVDAILREHFYAFVQRCLFTLNPGATFMPPAMQEHQEPNPTFIRRGCGALQVLFRWFVC